VRYIGPWLTEFVVGEPWFGECRDSDVATAGETARLLAGYTMVFERGFAAAPHFGDLDDDKRAAAHFTVRAAVAFIRDACPPEELRRVDYRFALYDRDGVRIFDTITPSDLSRRLP
jgi:hypothetical protein